MDQPAQPPSRPSLDDADLGDVGGPIDDPSTVQRGVSVTGPSPTDSLPDAQPLTNPDGSPDVLPPERFVPGPGSDPAGVGTRQDPNAQELPGDEVAGPDNIREGRGGGQPNPSLAEGGDSG
jgi:hypothetical protein